MATTAPPASSREDATKAAALKVQEYLRLRLKTNSSSTPSNSHFTIPIIDLSASYSSSLTSRKLVASEIHAACTSSGFFYITNHGIPPQTCAQVLTLASRFFHELASEEKEKIHIKHSKYFRGYEPASFSSVNGLELDSEGRGEKETKEAFNWGYEVGLDRDGGDGEYVELDGTRIGRGSVNQWPDQELLPGFYEGVKEYYSKALQLARHLFSLFALSLDLDETYFSNLVTHPGGIARLIRYPARSPLTTEEEIGLGAHTDYECFTLLLQSSTPGLEILSPDGQWIVAEPVEGGIVVNVADFLMRWTNGKYRSTVHRVVNRTGEERFSIPLFFSVNYDEVVDVLPGCKGDGKEGEEYEPITAGKYVLDRLGMTIKNGY
ncbi:hypothetical protein B7494_g7321 [Chlorociboria aeruginascens]|nr:hypothetical protein B7494_g7321 [Chlorociboria aeruginascens]